MVGNLIYALVIVGQTGQETIVSHFPTSNLCIAEAQRVIEQGPFAYCYPRNQLTHSDIQKQFNEMIILMKQFRNSMEQ